MSNKCVKLTAVHVDVYYTSHHLLGISGGVSFFTYLPTTPSFIVFKSFFLDNIILRLYYIIMIKNMYYES